ncbi:MAG: DUF362 domain-containing protein [Pyrinomonadaceae bacterium]
MPKYPTDDGEAALCSHISLVSADLGWHKQGRGSFGGLIEPGDRVVIKPNWVLHKNQGPWGMDPMITHPTIIKAVTREALLAGPSLIVIGDAPIQTCDFDQLMGVTGMREFEAQMKSPESPFVRINDFRRTVATYSNGRRAAVENVLPEDDFVLFDLGADSLLEPITTPHEAFRVTCYDPRLMARTHAPGKHRYLIAKEILEADVIINLPKLKTHKKAGVTCALKNLIGINGNKEYLPHHRIGGSNLGGDCYPGESTFKRLIEFAMDRQNGARSSVMTAAWTGIATQLNRALRLMGDDLGIEGSWAGNDTIWRTGLDLNRIVLYGKVDGSLSQIPQRKILHLVDAIVAGQGDGPLSPEPLNLGLLIGGTSAAAVDWISGQILGYDPYKIAIVREAFQRFRWPLVDFAHNDISLRGDWSAEKLGQIQKANSKLVKYPVGWQTAKLNAAY